MSRDLTVEIYRFIIESLRFFEDESRGAMRQVFVDKNVSVTIDRPI